MKVTYKVKAFTIQNTIVSCGTSNSDTKIILPSIPWIIKTVRTLLAYSQDIKIVGNNFKEVISNIKIDAVKKKDYYLLIINQPLEYVNPLNAMYFTDDIHNQNIKFRGYDVNIELGTTVQKIRETVKKFYF